MRIGCCARFFNKYEEEVKFAIENEFDFMQLWYDKDGLALHKDKESKIELINCFGFSTIIHAVLDINDFKEHIPKLRKILNELKQNELIIHPVCKSEKIDDNTIYKLSEVVGFALEELKKDRVKIYLENNSLLDPIFTSPEELKFMFKENKELNLLLDIAHIQSYDHLKNLIKVIKPEKLHVTDKHFNIIHEHLSLGQGELDFNYIFSELLRDFDGDIVLEVITSDNDIIDSKNYFKRVWESR